ncbi:MAG: hypothetical protein OXQ30_12670 [Boseongicola sp.]|nr:hypothetical protein [Boseongicola sp.]
MKIELFPRTLNLVTGTVFGGALILVGMYLLELTEQVGAGDPNFDWILGGSFILFGAATAIMNVLPLMRPTPSFTADSEGFSVMGKRKEPWHKFQGIAIKRMTIFKVFPVLSWVVVRSGKGKVFSRKLHIKWTHLSAPARSMADEIEKFARTMQIEETLREQAFADAKAARQISRQPDGVPAMRRPVRSKMPPSPDFADSPIKTMPERKRLLGG